MTITYQVIVTDDAPDEYRVEGIDYLNEGQVYTAIFSGPEAEKRAREYADHLNNPLWVYYPDIATWERRDETE